MKILDQLGLYFESHHVVLFSILCGIGGLGFFIWFIVSTANEEVKVVPRKNKGEEQKQGEKKQAIKREMEKIPVMSIEELAKNRVGSKVYVAVKNLVYDVTKSESYREGGGYHAFAGRDASVALARMNFNEENFQQHWSQPGLLDEK